MKHLKKFTVKEWKKFNKKVQADNSLTFRNYNTTKAAWLLANPEDSFEIHVELGGHVDWIEESYDYWTLQEVLLSKYTIILSDHANKWGVGVMCPTPLTEKIKSIPSKITQENFDKGMKKFDSGMTQFNKAVQTFSGGLGNSKSSARKDKENLNTLIGDLKSKNKIEIWSKKKTAPKKKRKKKVTKKTKTKSDIDKIWGKK